MPSPEELARQQIDALLQECGWTARLKSQVNFTAASEVAVVSSHSKPASPTTGSRRCSAN
jgi:hypothetical protein